MNTIRDKNNKMPYNVNVFYNLISFFFKRNKLFLGFISFLLIFLVIFLMFFKFSNYRLLYSNSSNEDNVEIVHYLRKMNVPYKFQEKMNSFLVPSQYLYETRFGLAEIGIPKKNSNIIGFELLDKEKFGISHFSESINYQRALEGELARTIERLKLVNNVRVHLAVPENSLFMDERKKFSSASVFLSLKPDVFLSHKKINAILHFISTSVSNLPVKNITIVDQFGNLLTDFKCFVRESKYDKIDYIKKVEKRYQRYIENVFFPLIGKENIKVQVSVEINFDEKESQIERYNCTSSKKVNFSMRFKNAIINFLKDKKEKLIKNNFLLSKFFFEKKIRSKCCKDKINENNFLKGKQRYKKNRKVDLVGFRKSHNFHFFKFSKFNSNSDPKEFNSFLKKTIFHEKKNIGEIKRISVSIVINYYKDSNGNLKKYTQKQMEDFENLARSAVGFSKERGDSISIINFSFFSNHKANRLINHSNERIQSESIFYKVKKNIYPILIGFLVFLCFFVVVFFSFLLRKNAKIKKQLLIMQKKSEQKIFLKNQKKKKNDHNISDMISNMSKNNPKLIAKIIQKWINEKNG